MNRQELPLDFHEKTVFKLRSLYNRYGYSQYKMSKFEEYDLYARNKDFLISDNVITFTDLGGKLMALKPDVTLSIVKNSKDALDTVQKLYYHENVYRASKSAHAFREIMQVGLECLGHIDDYCICEVLMLAAESLRSISGDSLLDISHLGLLSDVIDSVGVPQEKKAALLKCIGEKNQHELARICRDAGVSETGITLLKELAASSGTPETVLPKVRQLLYGLVDTGPLEQLLRITEALNDSPVKSMLHIDFSVVNDIHYYNGIVFKGFIQGLSGSILSGGQYDKLMQKLNRSAGAIGFAIYMDMLDRFEQSRPEFDVDVVLLYDEGTDLSAIRSQVKALTDGGSSVMVQKQVPAGIQYQQLLKFKDGEVVILENHA